MPVGGHTPTPRHTVDPIAGIMNGSPCFSPVDAEHYSDITLETHNAWNKTSNETADLSWGSLMADITSTTMPSHVQDQDHNDTESVDRSTSEGPYTCEVCGKTYARHCDKNKHFKTHSRPYKCSVLNCKYHDSGWPTEKELERHYNDKHASSPQTYSCLFQPCSYRSKRQSNCKQHMEKAHGWTYVRSRASNRETHPDTRENIDNVSAGQHYPGLSITGPAELPPGQDFVLYPDRPEFASGDEDVFLGFEHSGSQGSQSFIPWTSPMTRLRRNETFLQKFSQTYKTESLSPEDALCDDEAFPIDPDLSNTISSGAVPLNHESSMNHLTVVQPAARRLQEQQGSRAHIHDSITVQCQQPIVKVEDPSPQKGPVASHTGNTGVQQATSRHSKVITRSGIPLQTPASDDEGDHDEEDRPPRKRVKRSPEEDLDDTQMPCPFRLAHPAIYNRDILEKYSSCHTKHENISTIVRHFGRAAHRLRVDDRSISSFDMDDPHFRHPAAGLCKKCWRPFTDRDAFHNHLQQACANASRSKREKYRLLQDTFCTLVDSGQNSLSSPDPTPLIGSNSGFGNLAAPGSGARESSADVSEVDAMEVPEHTEGPELAPRNEEMVSMSDHIALRDRVDALEESNKKLVAFARYIISKQKQAASTSGTNIVSTQQPGQPGMVNTQALASAEPSSMEPRTSSYEPIKEQSRDQESLLGGMNSQSTECNEEQDFNEDTQQILSTIHSIASSEISTLRHVPLTPSARFHRLPTEDLESIPPADGQNLNTTASQTRGHRPKTSLTDSGYGSYNQRQMLAAAAREDQPVPPQVEAPQVDVINEHYWGPQYQPGEASAVDFSPLTDEEGLEMISNMD